MSGPFFSEKDWSRGFPISLHVYIDGVEFRWIRLGLIIHFSSIELMKVVKIPWWVGARGVSTLFPLSKKLYIILGGHSAFRPGQGVLFERQEGFWREVVISVKNMEAFIEAVERASGRTVFKTDIQ
ncbi:MAG: hypothetical protein RMJ28_07185 [Nitrososphaerota archaeon]|nr:hypothetical protein [Candidatus Calditenuaceae archaeon]MDW8073998.1 hypothetical protein [Nitrososphaerota archaeon]